METSARLAMSFIITSAIITLRYTYIRNIEIFNENIFLTSIIIAESPHVKNRQFNYIYYQKDY